MPKQKSHRGAAKRFSLTKTGKVKHKQMNRNLTKKAAKRKRQLRRTGTLENLKEAATIRILIQK